MRKNDLNNLRKKDIKDLEGTLSKKKLEAGQDYAKIKGGREKNLKKYKSIRRDIAQILTIIREKQIIENK